MFYFFFLFFKLLRVRPQNVLGLKLLCTAVNFQPTWWWQPLQIAIVQAYLKLRAQLLTMKSKLHAFPMNGNIATLPWKPTVFSRRSRITEHNSLNMVKSYSLVYNTAGIDISTLRTFLIHRKHVWLSSDKGFAINAHVDFIL